ncbi:MAG: hypothetical protein IPN59_16015 [Holophaga sp.]|nr:hypothetical protein [Holophaga sp.]
MNRPRSEKPVASDLAIEDPAFIEAALQALFESEAEFPIKVEGTSTLPYASVIKEIRGKNEMLVLKLIRPLPHELMNGALFQVIFPCEDKRYQARIAFQGREGYLQYKFTPPVSLTHADRRIAKRFPFRPRESAYVIAQDGRIPALGVAGPLVNIGLGGFAMRVDRVLKLDDGMRVPPSTALFDRERVFPRVRIQDLPRLPLLEWRGIVTHATARGDEVILGFDFGELTEDEARSLGDCLNFREKLMRGSGHPTGRTEGSTLLPPDEAPRRVARTAVAANEEAPGTDPLARLQRRSARVLLCMPEGEMRDKVQAHLADQGIARLECLPGIDELRPLLQAKGGQPAAAWVLLDLNLAGGGDVEPLAAMRTLERDLGEFGGLSLVMLCERVDPTLFLALDTNIRVLPYLPADAEEEMAWSQALEMLSVS